jgi:hypothetical protein
MCLWTKCELSLLSRFPSWRSGLLGFAFAFATCTASGFRWKSFKTNKSARALNKQFPGSNWQTLPTICTCRKCCRWFQASLSAKHIQPAVAISSKDTPAWTEGSVSTFYLWTSSTKTSYSTFWKACSSMTCSRLHFRAEVSRCVPQHGGSKTIAILIDWNDKLDFLILGCQGTSTGQTSPIKAAQQGWGFRKSLTLPQQWDRAV